MKQRRSAGLGGSGFKDTVERVLVTLRDGGSLTRLPDQPRLLCRRSGSIVCEVRPETVLRLVEDGHVEILMWHTSESGGVIYVLTAKGQGLADRIVYRPKDGSDTQH